MELLKSKLDSLQKIQNDHFKIANQLASADETNIYAYDLIAYAVLNRSISLISGFCLMIQEENFICAAPLVRLQLDNAIRFYASFLAEDTNEFMSKFMKGDSIRSIKDPKTKNKFTDEFLLNKLCEKMNSSNIHSDWLKSVYKNTSGYIHLSERHLFNATSKDESLQIYLKVGLKNTYISEPIRIEAIEIMIRVTNVVVWLLDSWIYMKNTKYVNK
jgi:hypothetical protein